MFERINVKRVGTGTAVELVSVETEVVAPTFTGKARLRMGL